SPPLALQARRDTTRFEDVRVEVVVPLADGDTNTEMGMGNRRRTGIIRPVRMPLMVSYAPTVTRTLPFAYAFEAAAADSLLPVLALHGIQVEQLTAPATLTVESFEVDQILDRGRNETPRNGIELRGRWNAGGTRTLPAGAYVVSAGQPFGLLAFYLLEAESDDGLNSYLTAQLAEGGEHPVLRVVQPAAWSTRAVP